MHTHIWQSIDMRCPVCKKGETEVSNSRTTKSGASVWRRRRCTSCGRTVSTYEHPSLDFLVIKKRSGKNARYAQHKLLVSIFDSIVNGKNRDRGDAAKAAWRILGLIEE